MKSLIKFLLLIPLIVISDENINIEEISYGDHEKQKIDFYEGSSDKVLIWIHGGGWIFGDKQASRWVNRFRNHFIDHENLNVYMIGYRIGEDTAPNAVNDVICAYKKILDDATTKNLSINDIVVSGASAGGHLALMTGFSETHTDNPCHSITKPKAIINLFGITEIERNSDFLDETKFFKASNYVKGWIKPDQDITEVSQSLSPIYLIDENPPYVLTIHGTSDRWVPYEQAILLDKKLGNKHELLTIDGGGHYYFSDKEDELIRETISSFLKGVYLE